MIGIEKSLSSGKISMSKLNILINATVRSFMSAMLEKNIGNVFKGYLEEQQMYLHLKRIIDFVLSLVGLIILSPVFLVLIIAIKLDTPGPILFKQKRVGINKSHFYILKFRTMRIDTPKDTPTHLLTNPDQYITKVGKFLRKTSLDELPQIINILKGEMAVIGPRPALWNQYDLIEERDKYGANDVPVGLTGWAQINGRDELEIPLKAKLDGEYAQNIGPILDIKCFFGTIFSVMKSDGVLEGGTGMKAVMVENENKGMGEE